MSVPHSPVRPESVAPVGPGTLLTISVGRPKTVDRHGSPAVTAIYKSPVAGPIRAAGINLDGDQQADRRAHGGPDKAVYAYADEDRRWWEHELGRPIEHGGFGENLTTSGVEVTGARIGERWRIGAAEFEVSEPRLPCWRLNLRMGDDQFIQRFRDAGRPGAYLRIVSPGDLEAGQPITIVDVPNHDLTVGDVAEIYWSRTGAERLLDGAPLSDAWQAWARRTAER